MDGEDEHTRIRKNARKRPRRHIVAEEDDEELLFLPVIETSPKHITHRHKWKELRDSIKNSFVAILSPTLSPSDHFMIEKDTKILLNLLTALSQKYPFLFTTPAQIPKFLQTQRCAANDNSSISSFDELFEFTRFWTHGLFSLLLKTELQHKSEAILQNIVSLAQLVSLGTPEIVRHMFPEILNGIRGENIVLNVDASETLLISYTLQNANERTTRILTKAMEAFLPNAVYYSSLQKTEYLRTLQMLKNVGSDAFLLFKNITLGRLLPEGESLLLALLGNNNVTYSQPHQCLLTHLSNSILIKLVSSLSFVDNPPRLITHILSSAFKNEGVARPLANSDQTLLQNKIMTMFQRCTTSSHLKNFSLLLEEAIFNQLLKTTTFIQRSETSSRLIDPNDCSSLWKQLADDSLSSSLDIKSLSCFIRLASRLNSRLLETISSARNKTSLKSDNPCCVPVYEFVNVEVITKWTNLAIQVLSSPCSPCDFSEFYDDILNTILAIDEGNFMNCDLHLQVSCKLALLATLPWLSPSCILTTNLPEDVTSLFQPAIINYNVSSKNNSTATTKGKSVQAMSCSFLIPWKCFIIEIFMNGVMQEENNTATMIQVILRLIEKKVWIFHCLPWSGVLNYLRKALLLQNQGAAEWQRNPLLRNALASAISEMPCLYFLSKTRLPHCPRCGCPPLFRQPTTTSIINHTLPNRRELLCVLKLAIPLMRSQFTVAKKKLCNLINVLRNHYPSSEEFPLQFISEFSTMAAKSSIGVAIEVMKKLALFFDNEDYYNDNNVGLEQEIFNTFLLSCSNKDKRDGDDEKILILIHEFSTKCFTNDKLTVEIIKFCLRILNKENGNNGDECSETTKFLTQKIYKSLAQRSNPPCEEWELLLRFKFELAHTIVSSLITKQQNQSFLSTFYVIGNFKTRASFTHHYFPVMMGYLVPYYIDHSNNQDDKYKRLIKFLASWASTSPSQLFINGFPFFFRAMALAGRDENDAEKTLQNSMTLLKTDWNLELSKFLFGSPQKNAMNELLTFLHDEKNIHDSKVLSYVAILSTDQSQPDFLLKPLNMPRMEQVIGNYFIAFLLHADITLHSRIEAVTRKRRILQSLTSIMELIGQGQVSSSKWKVYATLNSVFSLEPKKYADLHFLTWKTFVNILDKKRDNAMIRSILAAVTNLHDYLPSQTEKLFRSYFFHDPQQLYFLKDYIIQKSHHNNGTETAQQWTEDVVFLIVVSDVGNENLHIRTHAIKKLLHILKTEFSKIVKGKLLYSVVEQLISCSLLCTNEDETLRVAQVFGYLGAIDPYKFPQTQKIRRRTIQHKTSYSAEDSAFAARFLNVLLQEFKLSESTTKFDHCSCLIQQVLQFYKIQATDDDPVWKTLSNSSRDTLIPLLTSKYRVVEKTEGGGGSTYSAASKSPSSSPCPCPLYQSNEKYGKNFDSWLSKWVLTLAESVKKESTIGKIFAMAKHMIMQSSRIASFLLPYVVAFVIIHDETNNSELRITTEIQTILHLWIVQDKFKSCTQKVFNEKESQVEHQEEQNNCRKQQSFWSQKNEENIMHYKCTQQVFSVLDHLFKIVQQARKTTNDSKKNANYCLTLEEADKISFILDQIKLETLSKVAFYSQDFTRALFYWEQYLNAKPDKMEEKEEEEEEEEEEGEFLQEKLNFLQQLYLSLGDVDSVLGVSKIRKREPLLNEIVCESFAKGNIDVAVWNFERFTNNDADDLIAITGLLETYIALEEPRKAKWLIEGAINKNPSWVVPLERFQLQTAIKLKEWDKIAVEVLNQREHQQHQQQKDWQMPIAKILNFIRLLEVDPALQLINETRLKVMKRLMITTSNDQRYARGYPFQVQLHILTEIEQVIINIIKQPPIDNDIANKVTQLISKWEEREQVLPKIQKWIDPVLNVRKSLLTLMKEFSYPPQVQDLLDNSIRNCWLTSAKLHIKTGNFTGAANCINEAEGQNQRKCSNVMICKAKLLSRKGEKNEALQLLRTSTPLLFPRLTTWKRSVRNLGGRYDQEVEEEEEKEEKIKCSKAMLLASNLSRQLNLLDTKENIKNLEECIQIFSNSEKNNFTLAEYFDSLLLKEFNGEAATTVSSMDKEKEALYKKKIVKFYAQSLHYGCKYVYQSLPRLLTVWFDFAGNVFLLQNKNKSRKSAKQQPPQHQNSNFTLNHMEESIRQLVTNVPSYVLLTAISQLNSRICHPNPQCWTLLKEILCSLVISHPHQSLWLTMWIAKSQQAAKKAKCLEIYKQVGKKKPELNKMICDYGNFGDKLMQLCIKKVDKHERTTSLQYILPGFVKFLDSSNGNNFKDVLVPYRIFLNPSIPPNGRGHMNHDAFPEKFVYIKQIEDKIVMMNSQIRPKKITVIGSDGKKYGVLCKPNDDLRRDAKVMEINSVVNWYLCHRNQESKQRQLYVRVFAVCPLNEDHGILEWVPHLTSLSDSIKSMLYNKGIELNMDEIKRIYRQGDCIAISRARFQKFGLHKYPSVLSEWFVQQFKDPQSWYNARQMFVRTTAVMSIVGFILGLGDRHGENILLDSITGDCVHVDFNSIFNMTETNVVPEVVPFRLTHNMVQAMGPLGVDGLFRQTCIITLTTFRDQKNVFLSMLRPFVFDPLFHKDDRWAKTRLIRIQNRIEGTARNCSSETNTLLSVEAFVDHLINEATNIDNLCVMYYGWCSCI